MTKKCRALFVLIAIMIIAFTCMIAPVITYAETAEEQPPIEVEEETNIESLAESFTEYLKDKYGDDYEYYYNRIISEWGSVEGYLLAFGDKLPEEHQTDWDKFVGWLNEYAPIWVTALAVVVLIIAIVVGKSKVKKLKIWFTELVEKLVNKRIAPIENELNLQSNATISMMHAQKALLGTSEKFAGSVEELNKAEEELKSE